jgi:hypothetical protein
MGGESKRRNDEEKRERDEKFLVLLASPLKS